MTEQEQMSDHNCEETFTLCGLCIECWRVRAEKAEADFALLNARYESELEQTKKLEAERDKALAANKLLVEALEFTLEASGDPDAARLPEAIERMEQALAAVKQP